MAKQQKSVQRVQHYGPKQASKTKVAESKTFIQSVDDFLAKRLNIIFWVCMGLTLLFSLLLFDPKVSLSGDDAFYIIRASDLLKKFEYPSFQGPLYPIVLSVFLAIAGLNLTILKGVSLLAMLAFVYFTHKAFKNRVPAILHVVVLALVCINSFILYYASQTYSEAFYMFLQSILVLVFFTKFIDTEQVIGKKQDVKRHIVLALVLLSLTLTRSIGFSAVIAVFGYFTLKAQWRNLWMGALSFLGAYLVFQGIRYLLWGDATLQFASQGSGLLQKDYYNAAKGNEDFAGIMKRFWENSNLYLSKHFFTIGGLRKFEVIQTVIPILTVLFYIIFISGLVLSYFRNRYVFFAGLLSGSFLLITFIILQSRWDQSRLIIPVFSLMVLMFFSAFYYLSQTGKFRVMYWVIPVMGIIMFLQILAYTSVKSKEASQTKGKYGGLTPDWKHYLQASEWAANNLPPDAVVACRKPSLSYIYGKGRNFYSIMKVPSFSSEQFFATWGKENIPYTLFRYSDVVGKQLTPSIYSAIKNYYEAQLFIGEEFYIVDRYPDSINEKIRLELTQAKLPYITNREDMQARVSAEKQPPVLIYPDSLLIPLIDNGVTHVLTANLRRNSLQKNGQIINTVERYMAYIQDKYPDFMSPVQKIGSDEDEPAIIYKLNYERQKNFLGRKK
ncbi:MAG TPA: hypothetical protein PKI35_02250 [Bacteroidales bacterium]|nr:hypothetical protein [Bacteroidales bacterium]